MQSSQENIISISEFNKFLEGKIYRLAPMINFKYHTNAIIALCADEQYLGVATATSHYLYAKISKFIYCKITTDCGWIRLYRTFVISWRKNRENRIVYRRFM